MALEDKTVAYEVLIRYNAEGAPQGAHIQRRRIVTLDGELLKDEVLPAEPLTLDANFPVSTVMNEALEGALSQINHMTQEIDSLNFQLQSAQMLVQQLQASIAASAPSEN